MTTPLIEAIARKLESVVDYPDRAEEVAQAALTAITEAGYAVVPVEPTEAMRRAGSESFEDNSCSTHDGYGAINEEHVHIPWQAMISAAQGDGA